MVTVKDVAHRARVSTATVSRVINETRFVSEELRARVHQAMEELDYQPNVIARSLRCKKSQNIALVVTDIAYPFLAEVVKGVEGMSRELGYNAILCESNGEPERETACVRLLQAKQVDGLVFVAAGDSLSYAPALIAKQIPVVVCARHLPGVAVDTVIADDAESGYQATEHLIQTGHEHIGCIGGPPKFGLSDERVAGYKRALEAYGIPWLEDLVIHSDFRCQGGYEAGMELLNRDERPTAIFACNDLLAMGAICAASKQRLRIPEDVAIVGCDDIALASFTNPSLTTVAYPKHEMGVVAMEMLQRRIEGDSSPPTRRILPTRLVVRDSS